MVLYMKSVVSLHIRDPFLALFAFPSRLICLQEHHFQSNLACESGTRDNSSLASTYCQFSRYTRKERCPLVISSRQNSIERRRLRRPDRVSKMRNVEGSIAHLCIIFSLRMLLRWQNPKNVVPVLRSRLISFPLLATELGWI